MEGGAGAVFDTGLSCLVTLAVGPKMQQILGVLAIISPGWATPKSCLYRNLWMPALPDGDAWTDGKAAFCLVPIKSEGLQLSNDKCPDSTRTRWAGRN